MSEEVKIEAKEPSLFEVIDKMLSEALLGLHSVTGKESADLLNSLLDASIKFHQLTLAIQRARIEADRAQLA